MAGWLTAIAAGIVEKLVRIALPDPPTAGQLTVRFAIYAALTALVLALLSGRRVARWAVAVLLGGAATLSLIMEPLSWGLVDQRTARTFDVAGQADARLEPWTSGLPACSLITMMTGMSRVDYWLTVAAAVGAGVNGGVFFAFSAFVMPGLRELPDAQGIAAMQAFNRTAVTAPYMLALFGTAALCVVVIVRAVMTWDAVSAPWLLGGAIAYLLAAIVITGAGNIPLNDAIDALDPASANAGTSWTEFVTEWVWWNHLRTVSAIAAAAALTIALRSQRWARSCS